MAPDQARDPSVASRQAPVRGVLVHCLRQRRRKPRQEFLPGEPGLLGQGCQHLGADGLFKLIGSDLLVRSRADPGLRDVALTLLLEALHQLTEPAAEQASKPAPTKAAEKPAEASLLIALARSAGTTAAQAAEETTQATRLAILVWSAGVARSCSPQHLGDLVPVLEACHGKRPSRAVIDGNPRLISMLLGLGGGQK